MRGIAKAICGIGITIIPNVFSRIVLLINGFFLKNGASIAAPYMYMIMNKAIVGILLAVIIELTLITTKHVFIDNRSIVLLSLGCCSANIIINLLPYILGPMKLILDLGFMFNPAMWSVDATILSFSVMKYFSLKAKEHND